MEVTAINYISSAKFAVRALGDYDRAMAELHHAMAELITLQTLKREMEKYES